ncbi:hypothetical protein MASR2M18_01990 [Ignavibacteria bacterium]|nr:DUF4920 domain-containing protein [Bacteroidota bacterium]MCZ2132587.1 DUF4920 domain-containing protein [Bacteroidota bacterium]
MNNAKIRLIAAVFGLFFMAAALIADDKSATKSKKPENYGAKPTLTTPPLSLLQIAKEKNTGKYIRLSAQVDEVCQSMGCWLIVKEGDIMLRIKTKDHNFFVPKNIAGRTVIVEGIVEEQIIAEELARHYAEDAGKTAEEIEAIRGEQKELSMIASSIAVMP